MIDLKDLREDPEKYRQGAAAKHIEVDLDRLLELDSQLRAALTEQQQITAEKNQIGKQIGRLAGRLKKAEGDEKAKLQSEMRQLQQRPNQLKQREQELAEQIRQVQPQRDALWMAVPQPADADVPVGQSAQDNVEIRRWNPPWFDTRLPFRQIRNFQPKDHVELMTALGMVDFDRGVKLSGSRSYVLVGDGFRLHQALLRFAFDFMVNENHFTPVTAPPLVREHVLVGTGFFPYGRDEVYHIANPTSDDSLYLSGTGEAGLMAYHADEILPADSLPRRYVTMSTCFRREAGAAGKDTAGLYRIHQFDKVEQVVICQADEQVSRDWHQKMIGFVEVLLQRLELPYRLLQCCTGDLGPKNADMIDLECWMPSRGETGADGRPTGAYSETHSASRLYDYQCRRLNLRYKDARTGKNVFAHSLNNTVAASPRLLIAIIEMYQNEDGSITVPEAIRPYMNHQARIG